MNLSRHEKHALAAQKRFDAAQGYGKFLYQNNTSGDLMLPRANAKGQNRIGHKQQFEGDDYFLQMVKTNDLKLIKVIQTKDQQMVMEHMERLLTEQPPVVTDEGVVEFVKQGKAKKLNENKPNGEEMQDVLLNESPMDGIEII